MRQNNRTGLHEKGCLNVQAYVDVKKIATIASYLESTGELEQSQYGAISQYCINYFMAILEEHYAEFITRFETATEAVQWLDSRRFSMAQFKGHNNSRIRRMFTAESESSAEFGAPEYGQTRLVKSTLGAPSVPKHPTIQQQEEVARALYAQFGTIHPGFEYLFKTAPVMPDNSEAIILTREGELSVEEQNWQNAKAMARMILAGDRSKASPDCAVHLPLIDRALETVLDEMNSERTAKEDIDKMKLKAALLAGPSSVVA